MEYKLIKSRRRRTACIQVLFDGTVVVRAPYGFTKAMADDFVKRREKWIISKQQMMTGAPARADTFTEAELKRLHDEAKIWFPPVVEKYAKIIGVTYNRIFIKAQKTMWGSCSAKGNINLNCLLMLFPEDIREYVVIHELCHRRHMDHSQAFWSMVSIYCPDWKAKRAWLNKNGPQYIRRLPK